MKKLLIEDCSDGMMWYSRKIGKLVPYLGKYSEGDYVSIEDAGYTNIVREKDARIVEVECKTCHHYDSHGHEFLNFGERCCDEKCPCRECQTKDDFLHWKEKVK